MADINKEASWVTARLLELGNATNDGVNVLITDANIQYYNAGGLANTLGINKGGTGATDAAGARTNLDVPSTGDVTSAINTAVAPKADKVTGATSGNFAGLDANGDLTDSGSKASDFMPALASGATPGDVALIGSNSNIIDSGVSLSDILPSKSASGRLIKIYDGAKGLPLKSAILHINPRKQNNVMYPYDRGMFNVRQHMLLANEDLRDQIKYYMPDSTVDETNKTITFAPSAPNYADHGHFDAVQWDDGVSTTTFVLTCKKASGTSVQMPIRIYYNGTASYSNFTNIEAPVTDKQTIYSGKSANNISAWRKTNKGSQNLVVYYNESYITDIAITASDPKPEYVGERIVRLYPVNVYAGEFNLLTGELAVCPTIESYNGETLTGRWFSSLDDYAEGTTPTIGAFVVDLDGEKTTYQIDPVNMHTLQGYNRIWADYHYDGTYTNTLDIEYYVDPESRIKAVKESIAPIEDGYTASQAYTIGKAFWVGDTFYRATTNISSDATITPNTNCVETNLVDYILYTIENS